MDVGLIARRYATVLYDFASKRQELAEVNSDAQNIRGAFAENRVAYD